MVEVSDTTLTIDRNAKANAYALAGIKEYWIINLKDGKVELHLDPLPEEDIFSTISHHGKQEEFESPFCGPVRVADLLVEGEEN